MEHLVQTRLNWWMEKNNLHHPHQYGFRPNRDTTDVLILTEKLITETYKTKKVLLLVSIDIRQAFDSISHTAILHTLASCEITGHPLAWFETFIKGRTFKVTIGNTTSSEKNKTNGVPQGLVLSPILYSILLAKAQNSQNQGTCAVYFADDSELIVQAETMGEAQTKTQELID